MQLMTKCNKEVRFSLFLFTADIPGSSIEREKALQIPLLILKFWMSLGVNQTRYRYIRVVSFTVTE